MRAHRLEGQCWRAGRDGDDAGIGQAGAVLGPEIGHRFAHVGPCRGVTAGLARCRGNTPAAPTQSEFVICGNDVSPGRSRLLWH